MLAELGPTITRTEITVSPCLSPNSEEPLEACVHFNCFQVAPRLCHDR